MLQAPTMHAAGFQCSSQCLQGVTKVEILFVKWKYQYSANLVMMCPLSQAMALWQA